MGESGKIFIGNLAYSATDNDLRDLFQDFGQIEDCVVIMDRNSGESKGFGFVTFSDQAGADKAISEMAEYSYEGRNLNVKRANPRTGGGGGGFRSGSGGYGGGGYGGDRGYGGGRDRGYGGGDRGYGGGRDRGYGNGGGYGGGY